MSDMCTGRIRYCLSGSVPNVTGRVRYIYRTRPVFWLGVGRVAEVTGLWLSGVIGR